MHDANVKGNLMVTEASPVTGRYYGKRGETRSREVAGKPDSLLVQRKVESLQLKTVRFSAGTATPKQCNVNNFFSFWCVKLKC